MSGAQKIFCTRNGIRVEIIIGETKMKRLIGMAVVSLFCLPIAMAANSAIDKICQKPIVDTAQWQENDWHYCVSRVKRACVNNTPMADMDCATRVQNQTPECKSFLPLFKQENISADLLEWQKTENVTLVKEIFPADGGEGYILITPQCEINLMTFDLHQYDKTVSKMSLVEYQSPKVTVKDKNILVKSNYKVKSCKACAMLKTGIIQFTFDTSGKLKAVDRVKN